MINGSKFHRLIRKGGNTEGSRKTDTMVAISLYRGNLHQVSSAPRRWKMPSRTITPSLFQFLRSKRHKKHLSLLPPQQPSLPLTTPTSMEKTPELDNPPDPESTKMIVGENGHDEGTCHGGDDIATIQVSKMIFLDFFFLLVRISEILKRFVFGARRKHRFRFFLFSPFQFLAV